MDAVSVKFYKANWWMYLVSGIATLVLGLVTVINPAVTAVTLAFFFGLFLLITGVIDVVTALVSAGAKKLWFLELALGGVVALLGIYLLQRPGLALATFVVYVALALIVRSIIHVVEVFDSNYDAIYRTWQAIAAAVSALAAVFVWRYPVKGTLAFVWVIGVFAVINGPLLIAFALEAKNGFKKSK